MFTASNSQTKIREGKRNQLMLSLVQPKLLILFQPSILLNNIAEEISLSSRKIKLYSNK